MDVWTGGRAVVELLKAERVRHMFGIVGATFLDVLDTLYDDSSVEYINVRHEQAAAFMADGLARVTDRPAVCLVTSGPGATNLMTGVAAAYVAHSPVVVLVGGIALDHTRRTRSRSTTWSACPAGDPDQVGDAIRAAISAATPAIVEIPIDPDEFPTPVAAVRKMSGAHRGAPGGMGGPSRPPITADMKMYTVARGGLDPHLARDTQQRRPGAVESGRD